MNKVIEVCKNLKHTIDKINGVHTTGDSSLHKNNPWEPTKPNKSVLEKKLKLIMKKNNITYEQLK